MGQIGQLHAGVAAPVEHVAQLDLVVYARVLVEEVGLEVVQLAVGAARHGEIHGHALDAGLFRGHQHVDDPGAHGQLEGAHHGQRLHLDEEVGEGHLLLQESRQGEDVQHQMHVLASVGPGVAAGDEVLIDDHAHHLLLQFVAQESFFGRLLLVHVEAAVDFVARHGPVVLAVKHVVDGLSVVFLQHFYGALFEAPVVAFLFDQGDEKDDGDGRPLYDDDGRLHLIGVVAERVPVIRPVVAGVARQHVEVVAYERYVIQCLSACSFCVCVRLRASGAGVYDATQSYTKKSGQAPFCPHFFCILRLFFLKTARTGPKF